MPDFKFNAKTGDLLDILKFTDPSLTLALLEKLGIQPADASIDRLHSILQPVIDVSEIFGLNGTPKTVTRSGEVAFAGTAFTGFFAKIKGYRLSSTSPIAIDFSDLNINKILGMSVFMPPVAGGSTMDFVAAGFAKAAGNELGLYTNANSATDLTASNFIWIGDSNQIWRLTGNPATKTNILQNLLGTNMTLDGLSDLYFGFWSDAITNAATYTMQMSLVYE